jgi:hypothetical protein
MYSFTVDQLQPVQEENIVYGIGPELKSKRGTGGMN